MSHSNPQNPIMNEQWQAIVWIACCAVTGLVMLWYVAYCRKIVKPIKKLSFFARDKDNPIDWDISWLIFYRMIMMGAGTMSCTLCVVYAITEHWMLPAFPYGIRFAVVTGATFLFLQTCKSSTAAIHSYLHNSVTPTSVQAEPKPVDIVPDSSNKPE